MLPVTRPVPATRACPEEDNCVDGGRVLWQGFVRSPERVLTRIRACPWSNVMGPGCVIGAYFGDGQNTDLAVLHGFLGQGVFQGVL